MSQAVMDVCDQATSGIHGYDVGLGAVDTKRPNVEPKIEACGLMQGLGESASHAQDNDVFPESYASGETQSPMNVAPAATLEPTPRVVKKEPSSTPAKSAPAIPAIKHQKQNTPRNTRIVGKSMLSIRRGETGKTTFSASDLHLPKEAKK
jgi:hypothetical protein